MIMKSIKPGRGPSMMGGIAGIFMIIIGIGWTVVASQLHWLMALFGLCWTGIAVSNTIYNFKNAKGKNRYSTYDIVDGFEEPDPLNQRYGNTAAPDQQPGTSSRFCPYCGKEANPDFYFCPGCGKQLPD